MADAPLTLNDLSQIDIGNIKGVGEKRREALTEFGITNVLELLTTYPRRYVDRTNEAHVAEIVEGVETLVLVKVRNVRRVPLRTRRSMVTATVFDDTGSLGLTFFNQPWRERQLKTDAEIAVFGKPELYRGKLQMTNPVVDIIGDKTGRIVPIYPQSEKVNLSTWEIAGWVRNALERAAPRTIGDPLPSEIRERLAMLDRHSAFNTIHFPESIVEKERARQRLAFDELLRVQLVLVERKRRFERENIGIRHQVDGEMQKRFIAALPFPLTGAQKRVIAEINADLAKPIPMHRLLQGDVGSGKTVVAVTAMLAAVQGNHQGALMAPTEVLAEQHYAGIQRLLHDLKVPDDGNLFGERQLRVELLTGRVTGERRREVLGDLANGRVDIVIGTHALIQEGVEFKSLGVVVIDEQHRFGVEQRAALRGKGEGAARTTPDVLVMTATPIPRTLTLTMFGDLDALVLRERPPGRRLVRAHFLPQARWPRALRSVEGAVARGEGVFVVCPAVGEEGEKGGAVRMHATLAPRFRCGLVHGRMPAQERQAVLDAFRRREFDVLVGTTVLEVGVDVPHATLMVVAGADRFGLATLHQLRGRVGRGTRRGLCIVCGEDSPRLRALCSTTDGFVLAEQDLRIRGSGELLGTAQSGFSELRALDPVEDLELLSRARQAVKDEP